MMNANKQTRILELLLAFLLDGITCNGDTFYIKLKTKDWKGSIGENNELFG